VAIPVANQKGEADKAQVVTGAYFNGRFEVGPSPYHAPLIGDATGYGDIREGAEGHPGYWRHIDDEIEKQAAALAKINAAKESPVVINPTDKKHESKNSSCCKSYCCLCLLPPP
jgi:hypothetical protein